jgi:hypothetical protein
MALKSPGIITFMLSVILTVVVLITYFFPTQIPFFTGLEQQFWALLVAQLILIFGCIMRGL